MRNVFYILLLCMMPFMALSQDIKVLSVSDGSYPEIQVSAMVFDSAGDSIFIKERGENVPVRIVDSSLTSLAKEGKMYVFLVENSFSFFHNGVFPFVKRTLINMEDNFSTRDNLNILHYGTPGRNVKYISSSQTVDYGLLKAMTEDNFNPQTDSSYFDNNLISAIQEAFEYCRRHQRSHETVILTVVCRGLNLSSVKEFAPDFFDRFQKSGFYLNVLMYDSESQNLKRELETLAMQSGGNFSEFREDKLEGVLIQSLEKLSKAKPRFYFKEVMISFDATQNGQRNSFVVQYGNTEARCEYTNPAKNGFLGKYPISISILIGLLVVLSAIVFFIRTKKKIIRRIDLSTQTHFQELKRQNRILKQEIEKYKKHPLSMDHSFDNIYIEETLIGSGKIIPKLQIEDGSKHAVYKITKTTITIGRNESNDIVLENRTVSGHHATISMEGGFFFITDNNSTNGIFVNDIRITKYKLKAKDHIRIGSVMAQLVY